MRVVPASQLARFEGYLPTDLNHYVKPKHRSHTMCPWCGALWHRRRSFCQECKIAVARHFWDRQDMVRAHRA